MKATESLGDTPRHSSGYVHVIAMIGEGTRMSFPVLKKKLSGPKSSSSVVDHFSAAKRWKLFIRSMPSGVIGAARSTARGGCEGRVTGTGGREAPKSLSS